MKETSKLEKIERISVIIASILGVLSFFWQLANYFSNKEEKVSITLFCYVRKYSQDSPHLSFNVTNIGGSPIYLSQISFATDERVTLFPTGTIIPNVSPPIGSDSSYSADLIEPGASRAYQINLPAENLAGYKSVYLVVDSTRGELDRIGDLATTFKKLGTTLAESEKTGWLTTFVYDCSQPYVPEIGEFP